MNLLQFAQHVLDEQSATPNGDQEYIRLASEAIDSERHNSWSNRETWATYLHLTNDPDTYSMARRHPNALHIVRLTKELSVEALLDIGSLWRVNWNEVAAALANNGGAQ